MSEELAGPKQVLVNSDLGNEENGEEAVPEVVSDVQPEGVFWTTTIYPEKTEPEDPDFGDDVSFVSANSDHGHVANDEKSDDDGVEVVYNRLREGGWLFQDVPWNVEMKGDSYPAIALPDIPEVKTEAVGDEEMLIPKKEVETGESPIWIEAPEGFQLDPKATTCPLSPCKMRFRYSKHLQDHFFYYHEKRAPQKCLFCDSQFRTNYSLVKHVAENHIDLVVKKEKDPGMEHKVNPNECHDGEKETNEKNNDKENDKVEIECAPRQKKERPQLRKMPPRLARRTLQQKLQKDFIMEGQYRKGARQVTKAPGDKRVGSKENKVEATTDSDSVPVISKTVKNRSPNAPKKRMLKGGGETSQTNKRGRGRPKLGHVDLIQSGEFACSFSFCSKWFKTRALLEQHERIHTGIKPHKCPECSKTFAQSGQLKDHARIHTGARPYMCDICGKSFAQAGILMNHKKIHNKPYTCTFCDKDFAQDANRKLHEKIHM